MNRQACHEDLSAFMDGELGTDASRFLLRRLDYDAGTRGRWERYHLAQSVLRRSLPWLASRDFADRVAARLRAQRLVGGPPWLRWSTRLAGAAAVVAAVLMLVPQQPDIGALVPQNVTVATPAPAWLGAHGDPNGVDPPGFGYGAFPGNRDSLAAIDPLARVEASNWPRDEGVMPYLLPDQERRMDRLRPIDAADH